MSALISISGVSERDIDLLLLEEFHASPQFRIWFIVQSLGFSVAPEYFVSAQRSVTHTTGESDLEVVFANVNGAKTQLLIENKINAGFQPRQAERYRHRGIAYIARGQCVAFHTVIIAPERYFGEAEATKGFDGRLTYEQLHDWFLLSEELGERRLYKAALLHSAITKATYGYQPEEDASNTEFWRAYWLLSRQYAPELEMKEPSSKPSGSDFIYFCPSSLPKGVEICHKFHRGCVDLQLKGMGRRLNEVNTVLSLHFTPEMRLVGAAKSAAIRIAVPLLDSSICPADQMVSIQAGMEEARNLLVWFLKYQDTWLNHLSSPQLSSLDIS